MARRAFGSAAPLSVESARKLYHITYQFVKSKIAQKIKKPGYPICAFCILEFYLYNPYNSKCKERGTQAKKIKKSA